MISIIIGLISRYDNQNIDIIFWIGLSIEPVILFVLVKITKILTNKIKESEDI